jgi:hypothetical protein
VLQGAARTALYGVLPGSVAGVGASEAGAVSSPTTTSRIAGAQPTAAESPGTGGLVGSIVSVGSGGSGRSGDWVGLVGSGDGTGWPVSAGLGAGSELEVGSGIGVAGGAGVGFGGGVGVGRPDGVGGAAGAGGGGCAGLGVGAGLGLVVGDPGRAGGAGEWGPTFAPRAGNPGSDSAGFENAGPVTATSLPLEIDSASPRS